MIGKETVISPEKEAETESSNASTLPPLPERDQLWVKCDTQGKVLGTYEWDGEQWTEAKFPRETANYGLNVTIAEP